MTLQYTPPQLRDRAAEFLIALHNQDQQAFTVLAMLSWRTQVEPNECVKRITAFSNWTHQ